MMLLREKSIFKVSDVEMAILETNGELSVMKKTVESPITPRLLGMAVKQEHAPTLLIVDGNILENNLSTLGYSEEWLVNEIQKQGASTIEDVFIGQIDSKGELFVDLYNDKAKQNLPKQKPLLAENLKKLQTDLSSFSLQTNDQQAKQMYTQQLENIHKLIHSILPYLK